MSRFFRVVVAIGIAVSLSAGLLGVTCTNTSISRVDHVAVTLNTDLSGLKVSAVFPTTNTSTMSGVFEVKEYGSIFVSPYSAAAPLEFGFDLKSTLFSDTEYGALTPKDTIANGMPTANGKKMVEFASADTYTKVSLYGQLDIQNQEWMGATGIFPAAIDSNFPAGLLLTQWYKLDETGQPQIIVFLMGPKLNTDGSVGTPGHMSLFANAKELLASGQEPGVAVSYKKAKEFYTLPPSVTPTPTPTPTPTATPTPNPATPTPTPSPEDAIAPSEISWIDSASAKPGEWPITAKITSYSITSSKITMVREPMDNWPQVQLEGWSKPSVGNWWIIAKCNDGKWYAATMEWLGVGKTVMTNPGFDGGDDIHGCIGREWRPRSGETAYLMLSTHARSGVYNNNKQRSNIVKVSMP